VGTKNSGKAVAQVIDFSKRRTIDATTVRRVEKKPGAARVLLFTGVRYESMPDKPATPARPNRRRKSA
jgi:hypothetical protein